MLLISCKAKSSELPRPPLDSMEEMKSGDETLGRIKLNPPDLWESGKLLYGFSSVRTLEGKEMVDACEELPAIAPSLYKTTSSQCANAPFTSFIASS